MKKVVEIWLDDEGKYRAGTVDNSCLDVLMHILNLINQAGEELCKERSQIKIKKEIGDNK